MMASWLEIAELKMDIADSPDEQIRCPNAWKLKVFDLLLAIFSSRSNTAYSRAGFSSIQNLGWGFQFCGADVVNPFLQHESMKIK